MVALNSRYSTELTCPAEPFHVHVPFVSAPPQIPVLPPVERLVGIIDSLCAAIAARGAGGLLTMPMFFLLWSRLRRTALRATRVAARIAAGIPQAAARQRAPRPSRPQPLRLPRGFAWVVRLVPGAAAYGSQLQFLLADPQMAPLAADPSMRRLLNPLCQMLGVPKPAQALRPAAASTKAATRDQDGGGKPAGCAPAPPDSQARPTSLAGLRREANQGWREGRDRIEFGARGPLPQPPPDTGRGLSSLPGERRAPGTPKTFRYQNTTSTPAPAAAPSSPRCAFPRPRSPRGSPRSSPGRTGS